ncbi:MAG: histidine kinase [Burkholderiaceae bacterium]
MNAPSPTPPTLFQRWQRFSAAAVRAFHIYANWLVGISWKRFIMLALALLVGANILQDLPPFTWRLTQHIEYEDPVSPEAPEQPAQPPRPEKPEKAEDPARAERSERAGRTLLKTDKPIHYEITIDERGVRVQPRKPKAAASGSAAASTAVASAASSAASDADEGSEVDPDMPSIVVDLPKQAQSDDVKKAIEEARQSIEESVKDAQDAARDASKEAAKAMAKARSARQQHTTVYHLGDFLVNLAVLWILGSAVIKIMYKGRMQAEVKAAQAAETAEAESLKRQVIEARMAAMQAQVEPHFLFNTLASIDHLIETDPPRASQMQKNLIALLRASMPTMREANASGTRDLGRELAVIKPYLEILKMRMEERLQAEIDVPEGLLSAEFPPMMIQGLVENAIKHGLEPKAEGGTLKVKAEIVHGKLCVTVADTGLGFGRAATGGTGVGLANIRERLMLLYGPKGGVTVTENQPSGTKVTITVPYVSSASRDYEGAGKT